MKEKKFKIKDFIGIYDNYILPEECDKAIKLYENENKLKKTFNRLVAEGAPVLEKQDNHFYANRDNVEIWCDEFKTMLINFNLAWKHYSNNFGAEKAYDNVEMNYTVLKIQKTLPTEGYHVWHIEHGKGFENEARAFVFSIYLNDVKKGGETEFLHQSIRVKPKKGRIVIGPAALPYLHRGNPPLSGEKYILTSWLMLR